MVTPNPSHVLDMLRRLPPHERLKVISMALPEIEKSLNAKPKPIQSMRGLWKDLRPSVSAKEIEELRNEIWKDFSGDSIS